MSQHQCDTQRRGRPVRVSLGFDRRLNQFFLNVFPINAEGIIQLDRAVCSLVCESSEGITDLDYFREHLKALKVTVPEAMFQEVLRDYRERVGNHVIYWKLDWVSTVLLPKECQESKALRPDAANGADSDNSYRATLQQIMTLSGGPAVSAGHIAAIRKLVAEQLGISP